MSFLQKSFATLVGGQGENLLKISAFSVVSVARFLFEWGKLYQNRLKVGEDVLKTIAKAYTGGRKVLFPLEMGLKWV
jgi:hypothetical protein